MNKPIDPIMLIIIITSQGIKNFGLLFFHAAVIAKQRTIIRNTKYTSCATLTPNFPAVPEFEMELSGPAKINNYDEVHANTEEKTNYI